MSVTERSWIDFADIPWISFCSLDRIDEDHSIIADDFIENRHTVDTAPFDVNVALADFFGQLFGNLDADRIIATVWITNAVNEDSLHCRSKVRNT